MMTATSKANSSERTTGPLLWRLPSGSLVQGTVADGFEEVAEAFMQGFLDRGEIGASLCIRVDGDVVIDLAAYARARRRLAAVLADPAE